MLYCSLRIVFRLQAPDSSPILQAKSVSSVSMGYLLLQIPKDTQCLLRAALQLTLQPVLRLLSRNLHSHLFFPGYSVSFATDPY